ncbi:phage integrase family protein [Marinobacter nauticus]|uniref:Phage integrase family protein n=1 Tax=Marinobacter nauticus TaxID=2743 RepID=A0A368Y0Q2_MARNT|nr:tyrosine-type recombinase/integrase [Marinobacter nauticus]RCW72387.1 phage integrase family protein [Marinobacter nauticus]
MSKTGQARVLTPEQFGHLLSVIRERRYPEKNTALVQISFKLGLRVQEIALLQIKDVAELGPDTSGQRSFKLKEILALPAAYTKGADALRRSKSTYQRRRISFSVHDFHQLVQRIETMAKAGAEIKPEDFYPEVNKHRGKSRDLPMNDAALRTAIENYLAIRLAADPLVKKTDHLFLTQKGGPYSPNTLQEHLALMQRHWAGIERASSHSGRRTLMTNIIHDQKKSVKVAQKIAGHVSPSTTLIYEEPPEESLKEALQDAGYQYVG